jgi:hypothetical protein
MQYCAGQLLVLSWSESAGTVHVRQDQLRPGQAFRLGLKHGMYMLPREHPSTRQGMLVKSSAGLPYSRRGAS